MATSFVGLSLVVGDRLNQLLLPLLSSSFLPCLSLIIVSIMLLLLALSYTTTTTTLGHQPKWKLPPCPPRLPIIGNLHQLGELPHRSLRRLSDKYGPLMYLRLGRVPALVVSSAEMAKEVMKTHDLLFCNRPLLISAERFSYGGADMTLASIDSPWRKLCMSTFFSSKKKQLFGPIREDEVGILVKTISHFSSSSSPPPPINLTEMFHCLFDNITRRQVLGTRSSYGGKSMFQDLLLRINSLLGGFSIGDLFPNMKWLNVLTGWHARLENCFHDMDRLLEEELEKHSNNDDESSSTPGSKDTDTFICSLLRLQNDPNINIPLSRDNIKSVLVDMLIGGSDSSIASLEWVMSELVRNPRVMKKARDEVRRVVGTTKEKVDEGDLQQLQYLKLVIKETWRLHPPGPLLLPRECREDCKINGYDIPTKTLVLVNVWAIGRDPKYWEDPEVFLPERFADSSVDFRGQHFELTPFGAGRRICPGMSLGASAVELALANLLYKFNWELPDGLREREIDMRESFGVVCHRRSALVLMATPAIN